MSDCRIPIDCQIANFEVILTDRDRKDISLARYDQFLNSLWSKKSSAFVHTNPILQRGQTCATRMLPKNVAICCERLARFHIDKRKEKALVFLPY